MHLDFLFIIYILLFCIGFNLFFFFIAFFSRSDVFTDITYSLTFILVLSVILIWKRHTSVMQITAYIIVIIWAIRIGIYLFIRILKIKVDHRFDHIRNSFYKFLAFWFLQGISVFIIIVPIAFMLSINSDYFNINYFSFSFFGLAVLSLIYETIADLQKNKFYKFKKNKNDFMKTGLWKYSRHPNYFGEIMFWWFITISFLINLLMSNYQNNKNIFFHLLWLLSPLYISLLITFVSGLPLLEKKEYKILQNAKYYIHYINTTSAIIPLIGKKGFINSVKKTMMK